MAGALGLAGLGLDPAAAEAAFSRMARHCEIGQLHLLAQLGRAFAARFLDQLAGSGSPPRRVTRHASVWSMLSKDWDPDLGGGAAAAAAAAAAAGSGSGSGGGVVTAAYSHGWPGISGRGTAVAGMSRRAGATMSQLAGRSCTHLLKP